MITLRTVSIGYDRTISDGKYGSRKMSQLVTVDVSGEDASLEVDETGISPAMHAIAQTVAVCHQIANARVVMLDKGGFLDMEDDERITEKISAQYALREAEKEAKNAEEILGATITVEDDTTGDVAKVILHGQTKLYTREDAERDLAAQKEVERLEGIREAFGPKGEG